MVISGGNFKPDTLKPKEVVSLLLDDEEIELKCKSLFLIDLFHLIPNMLIITDRQRTEERKHAEEMREREKERERERKRKQNMNLNKVV